MPWLRVPAAVVAAYLAVVALAWLFQRRLIYLPLEGAPPPAAQVLPGAEEVVLETADGLGLGAWYLPGDGGADGATVVVCNGNAGNRAARAPLAAALARRGVAVLLFDYRGYGGNPGVPSEAGLLRDLAAARRFLAEEKGVAPGRQVLYGESLGAAVALAGAVARPPAGLVLRSPFASLAEVGRHHYPWLPVGWLLRDRYPNRERASQLGCPLLVIAGGRDRIVPPAQSRAVFAAAGSTDKRWREVPDADHNSPAFLDGPVLIGEVGEFAARVAGTG